MILSKHSKGNQQQDQTAPNPNNNNNNNNNNNSNNSSSTSDEAQLILTSFKGNQVVVSVKSPSGVKKSPNSVCCVVDISGSMVESAAINTAYGINDLGYSVLDIVKQALCTVIDSLDDHDSLTIITFSDTANVILSRNHVLSNEKDYIKKKVIGLSASQMTNLWSGLQSGMKSFEQNLLLNKYQQMIVFTDGKPNYDPPRGIVNTLKRLYDQFPGVVKPTINTFGFGYYLDSNLLKGIANVSNGIYYFIPDSSFVGTVFTNQIANMQSTFATNAQITLTPLNKASNLELDQINSELVVKVEENESTANGDNENKSGSKYIIQLGNLQYNSQKDFVIKQDINSKLLSDYSVSLSYNTSNNNLTIPHSLQATSLTPSQNDLQLKRELFRLQTINIINQVSSGLDQSKGLKQVNILIEEIEQSPYLTDPYIQSLLQDLKGQISLALKVKSYYEKWGVHYLPALAMAHTHKICSNFKDPGVQLYGGDLFNKLREVIEQAYISQPPLTPSHIASQQEYANKWLFYYESKGPCFDGDCKVKMGDGSIKQVKEVKMGDLVYSPNSKESVKVECVVQTKIQGHFHELVTLSSGLKVTPWHPVRINGEWVFPNSLNDSQLEKCESVYSFLLESGHSMSINEVECVTLAHGFNHNSVVSHAYYGTNKVIKDLQWMKGWWKGHVLLENQNCTIRNQETHEVIGLRSNRYPIQQWMKFIGYCQGKQKMIKHSNTFLKLGRLLFH